MKIKIYILDKKYILMNKEVYFQDVILKSNKKYKVIIKSEYSDKYHSMKRTKSFYSENDVIQYVRNKISKKFNYDKEKINIESLKEGIIVSYGEYDFTHYKLKIKNNIINKKVRNSYNYLNIQNDMVNKQYRLKELIDLYSKQETNLCEIDNDKINNEINNLIGEGVLLKKPDSIKDSIKDYIKDYNILEYTFFKLLISHNYYFIDTWFQSYPNFEISDKLYKDISKHPILDENKIIYDDLYGYIDYVLDYVRYNIENGPESDGYNVCQLNYLNTSLKD